MTFDTINRCLLTQKCPKSWQSIFYKFLKELASGMKKYAQVHIHECISVTLHKNIKKEILK